MRARDLLLKGHEGYPFSGRIRLDALRKLPPRGGYVHSDRVLLLQLGLLGRFYEVPEYLSICTRHAGQAAWTMPERNRVGRFRLTWRWGTLPVPEWWDPARARKITFPEWNAAKEFTRSVARSPLSSGQRFRCYGAIVRWALNYRRRFARDLVVAADQLLFNLQNRHATAANTLQVSLDLDPRGGEESVLKSPFLPEALGSCLTEDAELKPKTMVEIGGKSILWHILMHYAHYGHEEFVIAPGA